MMANKVVLEQAAQEFSEANKPHPRIYELEPKDGRDLLEEVQSSPVEKYNVDIEYTTFTTEKLEIYQCTLYVQKGIKTHFQSFSIHTVPGGWVFGSAKTHDKLVRELAVRTNSVVVFPEYTLSPEAKYPTAIEQNYDVLQQLKEVAEEKKIDINKLTVAGDSVGGNMATVMTIMTKQRNGLPINQQLLYYPVTNAEFDTESYNQFAENYFLAKEGMQWFWDQYTTDPEERLEITASPLRATIEDLKGLPSAMILNAEADVLRDEGEEYANKLREAGVEVTQMRFQGIIHDFVMVNSMDQTNATRAAMDVSTSWINKKNNQH